MSLGQLIILLIITGMILITIAGIVIENMEAKELKLKKERLERHNEWLKSELEYELIKRS